jgi:hypothetical protein
MFISKTSNIVIVIIILCLIIITLVQMFIFFESGPVVHEESLETVSQDVFRTLTGEVISVSEDGSYVRVAIPDEGVYSIALGEEQYEIGPSDTITIIVKQLPDTERYDFVLSETVEISSPYISGDSIEDKIRRIEKMSPSLQSEI